MQGKQDKEPSKDTVQRENKTKIPVGVKLSSPVQTSPGAHPASYAMGKGSCPEVKRPARGADHPPPPIA